MIKYVEGDVLNAVVDRQTIIMHVCNDQYVMGAGIALQIAQKWPRVEEMYKLHKTLELGTTQWCTVGEKLICVNLIAQTLGWVDGKPPLSYEALRVCLMDVAEVAKKDKILVRAPMIGSLRSGGKWNVIEEMIESIFNGVEVEIYKLPENSALEPLRLKMLRHMS